MQRLLKNILHASICYPKLWPYVLCMQLKTCHLIICKCVCVCVHACVRACTHVCVRECVCVHVCVYGCTYSMCVCTYRYVYCICCRERAYVRIKLNKLPQAVRDCTRALLLDPKEFQRIQWLRSRALFSQSLFYPAWVDVW